VAYLLLKSLHLLGAAVLFGTGLGIAFFAWFGWRQAARERNLGLLRGVLRLTVTADAVFTATAALLQPVTGALLWRMTGLSWLHPWMLWVLAVYAFVGCCWLPVVWIQMRLRDRACAAANMDELGPEFTRLFWIWFILGWPAFAGVLVLFGLMVGRAWLM